MGYGEHNSGPYRCWPLASLKNAGGVTSSEVGIWRPVDAVVGLDVTIASIDSKFRVASCY